MPDTAPANTPNHPRMPRSLRRLLDWLLHGRRVVFLLAGFLVIDVAILTALDARQRIPDTMATLATEELLELPPTTGQMVEIIQPVLGRAALTGFLLGLPLLYLWHLRRRHRHPYPVAPVGIACIGAILWIAPAALAAGLPRARTSPIGEEPYVGAFVFGILLLALLLATPWIAIWLYARSSLLDRFVTRAFLTPFLICFGAFVSIWIISDLANRGAGYARSEMAVTDIAWLYLLQLPAVIVIILPITLVLASLYTLGRMSRSNELVSMLMAGRSVYTVLRPIFAIAAFATFVSLVCNYEWAPTASGTAESAAQAMSKGTQTRYAAYDQVFVNRPENRIWFVGMFPHDYHRRNRLRGIFVAQFDDDNILTKTIQSNSVFWQDHNGLWVFFQSQVTEFNEEGEPASVTTDDKHLEWDWPETPWLLMSTGIRPEFLGLPQIGAYLRAYQGLPPERLAPFYTHWHHRLALPFACLTAVLVAAPLGIIYSRRGLAGSVTAAILLFFASLFITNLFLALGQSQALHPFAAAWLPLLLFAGIGLWLLRQRNANREIINPLQWLKQKPSQWLGRSGPNTRQPAAT